MYMLQQSGCLHKPEKRGYGVMNCSFELNEIIFFVLQIWGYLF